MSLKNNDIKHRLTAISGGAPINYPLHSPLTGYPVQTVLDMETSDPDDFLTLLLLLGHPKVHLKAVTLYPGAPDQVGFIKSVLNRFGRSDIEVGGSLTRTKPALSHWHHLLYDTVGESGAAVASSADVLRRHCDGETLLITGGPLKNLANAIKMGPFRLGRLVAQGGFCGANIVPTELQLSKFKGLATCASANLGGDIDTVNLIQTYAGIESRYFVSKNVCHGVSYNNVFHNKVDAHCQEAPHMKEVWRCMDIYLSKKSEKLFHDPFAACCAINPAIGQWEEVSLYSVPMKNHFVEWGSNRLPGSKTWIVTQFDRSEFEKTFFEMR